MAPSLQSFLSHAGSLLSQLESPSSPTSQLDPIQPRPILTTGSFFSFPSPSYYHMQPLTLTSAPSCPLDGPTSCHNSTPVTGDPCCFVYPGGRILLTQFWDQKMKVYAGGADQDWTLHGLWCVFFYLFFTFTFSLSSSTSSKWVDISVFHRPDLCDGTYDQFCHMTPRYDNITAVLEHHGQHELLQFMDRYWLANSYVTNSFFFFFFFLISSPQFTCIVLHEFPWSNSLARQACPLPLPSSLQTRKSSSVERR